MEETKQTFEELKPMLRPTGVEKGVMRFDAEKCTSCGLCILNCPFKCLEMDAEEHPKMKSEYTCMSCFNCQVACPTEAISIERTFNVKGGFFDTQIPPVKMPLEPKDAEGKATEWNPVERMIIERRSVRHFKEHSHTGTSVAQGSRGRSLCPQRRQPSTLEVHRSHESGFHCRTRNNLPVLLDRTLSGIHE